VHPPSGFHAWRTTSATVANTTLNAALVFDHVEFDSASEYNVSTGVFTPTNGGVYAITCGVFYAPTVNAYWSAILYKNGTTVVSGTDVQSSLTTGAIRPETSVVLKLAAGDQVTCGGFQTSGSSVSTWTIQPTYTAFSAARLY
jgi:hypothetical protein